jgi:hypothetical protein
MIHQEKTIKNRKKRDLSEYIFDIRYRNTSCKENILSFDKFSAEVPSFNFEGRPKIGSLCGSILSLAFYIGLLAFGVSKIDRIIYGLDPSIAVTQNFDFYPSDH